MAFSSSQEENIAAYGGYGGGMGGSWAMIILIVVILWVLFSKDGRGHDGGYGAMPYSGYGFGGGCGPCVQPTFKDESNFEEERNINAKLCCMDKSIWETDRDVWKTACETQKEIDCDGQKTRALIEANYIQDLRDKITEQNSCIQTMKSEAFTTAQIGLVNNKIEKVDEMLERLACELPKRQPVYAECVTPCTRDLDRDCFREIDRRFDRFEREFPRRGRVDRDFCECGC